MADCIGKVFLAVETVPAHIDIAQIEEMGRWWHQMLCWSRVLLSRDSEPPEIEWHEPTEER